MSGQAIDPIRLEIIRTGLQSIPDLVEDDISRTAYSPIVYEYKDFAVGIVDVEGRIISLATNGLPVFLLSLIRSAIRDGKQIFGDPGFSPGDVIVTNHGATLGQHLNNAVMYAPIFGAGGRLRAFMAVVVHWIDIGGRYPGSTGVDNTDIFQEGIQLRSVKLYDRGERRADIFRIIETNTRVPHMLMGDIEAQLAGCIRGRLLFEELMQRQGEALLFEAIEEIWDRSEAASRAALSKARRGVYRATSFLDNDGLSDDPVPIDITVSITEDEFVVDYSRLGKELAGPYNCTAEGGGIPAAYLAFKLLFSHDRAPNDGDFRPVRIILPDGTFLSAGARAPLSFYQTPLPTVVETILKAVAPVMEDRVIAGTHAAFGSYGFAGTDPATGRMYQSIDVALGGWGASRVRDGASPLRTLLHGDARDIPVESLEATTPVRVESYRWRPDTEGAGRYRGGPGVEKVFRITQPGLFRCSFERSKCPPWGLFGGGSGEVGGVRIERADGSHQSYQKVTGLKVFPGDRIRIATGGGGGVGPAAERDEALVLQDVLNGVLTRERARDVYGVVVSDTGEIDRDATCRSRARS